MKLRYATALAFVGVVLAMCKVGLAQETKMHNYSEKYLLSMRNELELEAAKGAGSASKKLDDYPNHYTMIALREKSGVAEVHKMYADIFYILDGQASLITGGTVKSPKTTAPGELVGTQVLNGKRQELCKGDVVHIAAGMPHQMILADRESVMYFVVKVKES